MYAIWLILISIWSPDYKLTQSGTVELRNKKKSQLKKVTGFQVNSTTILKKRVYMVSFSYH